MAPRYCKICRSTYDDFMTSTTCPHKTFTPSESAAKHLMGQGIDPFSYDGQLLTSERKELIDEKITEGKILEIPILPRKR